MADTRLYALSTIPALSLCRNRSKISRVCGSKISGSVYGSLCAPGRGRGLQVRLHGLTSWHCCWLSASAWARVVAPLGANVLICTAGMKPTFWWKDLGRCMSACNKCELLWGHLHVHTELHCPRRELQQSKTHWMYTRGLITAQGLNKLEPELCGSLVLSVNVPSNAYLTLGQRR